MILDDFDGIEIDTARLSIAPAATKYFFFVTNARAGFMVRAAPQPGIIFYARLSEADEWQNIGTTPLDLTAHAPEFVKIYFQCFVGVQPSLITQSITIRP